MCYEEKGGIKAGCIGLEWKAGAAARGSADIAVFTAFGSIEKAGTGSYPVATLELVKRLVRREELL